MESGNISIKSIVAGTRDCGSESNKQELQFYQALRMTSSYEVVGNQLELLDSNGEVVLIFEEI